MALVDFSNYANGIPCEDTSRSILGPFSFIEKAIFRRIEHSKQFRVQPAALGLLYNAFSMEEENFSTLLPSLIAEVEDVLMQKKDCEILLRCFYQNIYPFYPFMDISLFESDLTSLLLQDDNNRWKISTEVKNVRKKIETLSLLTIVMAMALMHSKLDANLLSMVKENASESARKLSLLCHKLLCLLDVFRYPNENTFTCLLYFYVSEHLDPESPDCVLSPTNLLTLHHLLNLSMTLGLQYEPSKYKRFKDPEVIRQRRILWLGVQSLLFQISLAEGDAGKSNSEYMEAYLTDFEEYIEASSEYEKSSASESNVQMNDIVWNKYKFHVILSKLMSDCTSVIQHPQLFHILENIKRSEDFMAENFPTSSIYQPLHEKEPNAIKVGKSTVLDVMDIQKTEIFLTNIVGKSRGYIIDKQICFMLVRIWMFQCRILLRFSYKQESQKKLASSSISTNDNEKEDEMIVILERLIKHIRNQMAHLVDLAKGKLQDSYFGAYQTVPMFRYVVYLIDVGGLVSVTNGFWDKISSDGEIPPKVQQAVRLKWGLDCNNSRRIKQKLISSQSLQSFNQVLLCQMEDAVLSSSFAIKANTAMSQNTAEEFFNISEEEALNQLLENNNFDAFWDLLGENLSDMPSL
ncbi:CRL_G0017800.mRNA.1.CDS.1 [Saccharomyces cerevisiae]|nr:CRL_G0017800.mRNA.1.CDS.1 [Saccharomyces cerevisiae]CAI7280980.1 CRL_G0017800.mRNA.1.CDS.1 [Saccharomyces cerevisiae]